MANLQTPDSIETPNECLMGDFVGGISAFSMEECATLVQFLEPNTPHSLSVTKVTSSYSPHLYPESVGVMAAGVELLPSVSKVCNVSEAPIPVRSSSQCVHLYVLYYLIIAFSFTPLSHIASSLIIAICASPLLELLGEYCLLFFVG